MHESIKFTSALLLCAMLSVTAQVAMTDGFGFFAPAVNDKDSVHQPATGEIVYDATDSRFYGRTHQSAWTNLSDAAEGVPTGTILPFGGTAAPPGYLMCDGGSVSRATNAALFAVIGESFGNGDGSLTFNLPDLRGQFLRGVSNGTSIDPDKNNRAAMAPGANVNDKVGSVQSYATARPNVSFTTDNRGTHAHTVPSRSSAGGSETGDGFRIGNSQSSGTTNTTGSHPHAITGGGDAETRPPNAYVNFIIKT